MTVRPPSSATLRAFSVGGGDPVALDGGEGVSFRVGDAVLKRVHDVAEAEWTQELLSRVQQVGFRLADPLPTLDGRWVHEGWSASRFVPNLVPLSPDWHAITDVGLRFDDAAEGVRTGGEDVLSARTHRWAHADRVAWGEAAADLDSDAQDVMGRFGAWLRAPSAERHFVHGDLSGNVFVDATGVPVILDVSPYLRPRRWAEAIVHADAMLWSGAGPDIAGHLTSTEVGRDLLGRALIFRLVAEPPADEPRHGERVEPYRRVLGQLR